MLVWFFILDLRLPRCAARVAGAFCINEPSHQPCQQPCTARSRCHLAVHPAGRNTRLSRSIPQGVGITARFLARSATLCFRPAMSASFSNTSLCGRPAEERVEKASNVSRERSVMRTHLRNRTRRSARFRLSNDPPVGRLI